LLLKAGLLSEYLDTFEAAAELMHTISQLLFKPFLIKGFKWGCFAWNSAWKYRLSELADYRRIHAHCNCPERCSENIQFMWVRNQWSTYMLQRERKMSIRPPSESKH
jgi:hypothetical protein